jgi:hypothetical protein
MCFNVFLDIVIGISPLHSHCKVFAMHTHLHIFFHFVFESIKMYLNIFECTYSRFMVYFNISIVYLNVFQCIGKYLSLLESIGMYS